MEKIPDSLKNSMSETDFSKLMQQIEASNEAQAKYAKKQYVMSKITAIASLIILGIVIYVAATLLPKANATFENLDLVMRDLKVVSSELAESDLEEMINNVNYLVSSSQQNVQDALTKLNSIDIESLNKAIKDLSDVVAPLAKFANYFQ